MTKKIALGLVALVAVAASVVGLSAFEAHVINVTAKIENALRVETTEIDFGTVFPQEQLDKPLEVALSQSFLDEDRVDDVEYVIRQKPKCAVTTAGGTQLENFPTATGHVNVDSATGEVTIDCGPAPAGMPTTNANWGVLPSLCEYVSKHPDNRPENDGSLDSFHAPYTIVKDDNDLYGIRWNDTKGHLAKLQQDIQDLWTIDLAVPCFGNHCAQDWEAFVTGINASATPASQWVQPIANEHKIFGCDLWIEVFGISLPGLIPCGEDADLMLVLDRSGSVSAEMPTLIAAAKGFVDALAPATPGAHVGMVSFASTASSPIDAHLTDDGAAVKAAIDLLVSSGLTNLEDALLDATAELANPGDGDDRADGDSPDFIVLITDGAPTASNTGGDHSANASAAATAAKAAGITIYVVGVGTTSDTADYLKTIATSAGHYFDATDFAALAAILDALVDCPLAG